MKYLKKFESIADLVNRKRDFLLSNDDIEDIVDIFTEVSDKWEIEFKGIMNLPHPLVIDKSCFYLTRRLDSLDKDGKMAISDSSNVYESMFINFFLTDDNYKLIEDIKDYYDRLIRHEFLVNAWTLSSYSAVKNIRFQVSTRVSNPFVKNINDI